MGTTLENGNWIRSTFFFFLPCLVDCRILLPLPGTKSALTAMEVRSLNHWTVREIPKPLAFQRQTWTILESKKSPPGPMSLV